MALDRHVVRRVGEDHRSAFRAHQGYEVSGVKGIAAQHAMGTKEPQIPDLAEWRPRRKFGYRIDWVVGRVRLVFEGCDAQIDLAHLKAGELEAEIEAEQREVLELLSEQPVIPGGDFGEPVVGDHEGACLLRGQVIKAQRRHLGPCRARDRRAAARDPRSHCRRDR